MIICRANFEKQKLEESGIMCYLADENTIAMEWTLKNALGGIKLSEDVEKAKKILKEKTDALMVDHKIDAGENELVCPKCGSNNTVTEKHSNSSIGWSWLIFGFPVSIKINKQHRCFYCDHKWKT